MTPKSLLRAAFDAALEAAQPENCLPGFLPGAPRGRTVAIGAGKAAAAMALALDHHWERELTGVVVTATGHGLRCPRIEVLEAAHPVPSDAGERAAREMLRRVSGLGPDDLVICLLSGGGSALMSLPAHGLASSEKQAITRELLRSGAAISEINCVRRHLSSIKGGRLGVACSPARLVTLAISDVPGDDPVDIASGPTVADPTTCADALAILDRRDIAAPNHVRDALSGGRWESVQPGDPRLARAEYRLVATPQQSLDAAAAMAREQGVTPLVLSDRVEGEARAVGREMAAIALAVAHGTGPARAPCLLLSGGETTVTVRSGGRGGRNVEFLLSFGIALGPAANIHAIACDTDGVDGTEPIAGAVWAPDTLERAGQLGLEPKAFLDANDAHSFFGALGDGVVTGPTRTNVNDFRAILVLPVQ
ncbi:MAG: glycerate kinase [Steroidobacteraceae bacterium]|nr:glycerate kinase [Steroidobacteraceae bacterium]